MPIAPYALFPNHQGGIKVKRLWFVALLLAVCVVGERAHAALPTASTPFAITGIPVTTRYVTAWAGEGGKASFTMEIGLASDGRVAVWYRGTRSSAKKGTNIGFSGSFAGKVAAGKTVVTAPNGVKLTLPSAILNANGTVRSASSMNVIGLASFDVPLAAFDVPLAAFDVPLAAFDVPLAAVPNGAKMAVAPAGGSLHGLVMFVPQSDGGLKVVYSDVGAKIGVVSLTGKADGNRLSINDAKVTVSATNVRNMSGFGSFFDAATVSVMVDGAWKSAQVKPSIIP